METPDRIRSIQNKCQREIKRKEEYSESDREKKREIDMEKVVAKKKTVHRREEQNINKLFSQFEIYSFKLANGIFIE